ncbi:hypothetical protein Q7P36_010814 [Cladosporium allicinum]
MPHVNSRALLIGCDFYFAGSENTDTSRIRFPHLRGAVQDVNDVQAFLLKNQVPRENIVTLTASHDPRHPSHPTEVDKCKWPTHANIVRELENIANVTDRGALVYIHYSGHGIQRSRVPELKMSSGGDALLGAALATTDATTEAGRYLTTNELGIRIQAMVDKKGLRVTLVLDACFSGGGLRFDTTYAVRTILDCYDDRNLGDDEEAQNAAREYVSRLSGTRQAKVTEDWLSKPVGCTVLTACGIHQTAAEGTFQSMSQSTPSRGGFLTHWILDCLSQRQTPKLPSYSAVKEYVTNKIKAVSPALNQTPVLYGDTEYEFFGSEMRVRRPACRVLHVEGDTVVLDVGSAQGVVQGAIYDIYPSGVDIEDSQNFHLASEARITTVQTFCSGAKLAADHLGVTPDCSGVLRTWALSSQVLVNFNTDEAITRKALQLELGKTPNLVLQDGPRTQDTSLVVRVDQDHNFEIIEHSSASTNGVRLQRLPVIALDAELAIEKLAHVLRHVSRYRDIKQLLHLPRSVHIQEERLDVKFSRDSIELDAVDTDGVQKFEVVAGESLGFRLEYKGPASQVWVAIFELNPSWGIVRRYAKKLERDRLEPPLFPIPFQTEIPPKSTANDSDDTNDTFMAFIAEGEDEQSWDEIALDALPIDGQNLRIDTGVDVCSTTETRQSKMGSESTPRDRKWGVVAFVVHSSPPSPGQTSSNVVVGEADQ